MGPTIRQSEAAEAATSRSPRSRAVARGSSRVGGFTLIEVLAVVVVLGILASLVAIKVNGHVQRARLVQAADQLAVLDRRARDEARQRSVPLQLQIDTDRGVARIRSRQSAADGTTPRVVASGSVSFADVRLSGNRPVHDGTLDVSSLGQSETYAVRLSAPDGAALWLVTLGLSGQHLRLESEEDVREVLLP